MMVLPIVFRPYVVPPDTAHSVVPLVAESTAVATIGEPSEQSPIYHSAVVQARCNSDIRRASTIGTVHSAIGRMSATVTTIDDSTTIVTRPILVPVNALNSVQRVRLPSLQWIAITCRPMQAMSLSLIDSVPTGTTEASTIVSGQ